MKITVFSAKGGVGKTPISTNIAFDRDCMIATNDEYHGFDIVNRISGEDRCLVVQPHEEFPDFPDDWDVVFDLGGTLSSAGAPSVRSALAQSDLVIVPVSSEIKSIISGVKSINEAKTINKNILVVATKLKRTAKETTLHPWSECREFLRIRDALTEMTGEALTILPLKFSAAFDAIFENEKSLREMVKEGGADGYHYAMPSVQFEDIYKHIEKHI